MAYICGLTTKEEREGEVEDWEYKTERLSDELQP